VAIRGQERLAVPLEALAMHLREPAGGEGALEPLIAAAETALSEWEARLSPERRPGAWIVVSAADPLQPASEWLHTLVELELAWCRRLHLAVAVVAYETREGEIVRAAIEVEGPGAAVLEMEQGLHRMAPAQKPQKRARVDVLPRGSAPRVPGFPRIMPTRTRKGPFGLELRCQARQAIESRALTIAWVGGRRDALEQLMADVDAAWSAAGPASLDNARVYDGSGARDPRTGGNVPRLKDALRGKLEPLLAAWRAHLQGPLSPEV
jgi:hypothetical protein